MTLVMPKIDNMDTSKLMFLMGSGQKRTPSAFRRSKTCPEISLAAPKQTKVRKTPRISPYAQIRTPANVDIPRTAFSYEHSPSRSCTRNASRISRNSKTSQSLNIPRTPKSPKVTLAPLDLGIPNNAVLFYPKDLRGNQQSALEMYSKTSSKAHSRVSFYSLPPRTPKTAIEFYSPPGQSPPPPESTVNIMSCESKSDLSSRSSSKSWITISSKDTVSSKMSTPIDGISWASSSTNSRNNSIIVTKAKSVKQPKKKTKKRTKSYSDPGRHGSSGEQQSLRRGSLGSNKSDAKSHTSSMFLEAAQTGMELKKNHFFCYSNYMQMRG